ncbi:MAG: sigma-70 family RNA polymerase sigma factor [Bacteroidota bacterium]
MSGDFYHTYIAPHRGILVKICRAYTHSQADFEDYYQEVCLQLWKSREAFQERSAWSTWVYRVTLNVCLSLQRKSKKEPATSELLPEDLTTNSYAFQNEELELLYAAIRQLKEVDRALILLYLEEKSHAEIAEILGTNPNNIGVRLLRIKERLKKLLDGKIN